MTTSICWFRRDLRIADNRALSTAVRESDAVVPAFVIPAEEPHGPGPASRAWMNRSLAKLDEQLVACGSGLVVRVGEPGEALVRLARECAAQRVHCQRVWTPEGRLLEDRVRATLEAAGIALQVHEGQLLVTPEQLTTASGTPYRVFTPYYNAWMRTYHVQLTDAPARVPSPAVMPASSGPVSNKPGGPDIPRWWTVGAVAASARLVEFVDDALAAYPEDRDRPDRRGTSELSMRLAWGELSPSQVMAELTRVDSALAQPFARQIAWREFAHHVLHHFPHTLEAPMRAEFGGFPWRESAQDLEAWKAGETGYPLVDAGMRQLLATGWMHNRVRMVCASFLVKDLLIDWREGERHFRERLVDYDPALNAFNWQWVAGSGADAAPYFRIFNPATQARKFDPDGVYAQRWAADAALLQPMLDHAQARDRALAALASIKDEGPAPGRY